MAELPIQWQFVEISDGKGRQWLWRRLVISGEIAATSQTFEDFGAAIHDAIAHGFKPSHERWVTLYMTGVTYFDPVDGARVLTNETQEAMLVYRAKTQKAMGIRNRVSPRSTPSHAGHPARSKSRAAGKARRIK